MSAKLTDEVKSFDGITMKKHYDRQLTENSQSLRKNMTKEEKHLWYDFFKELPVTVNRQKIIGNYIVDFYCDAAKTAIELDGSEHFSDSGIEYDRKRDEYLNSLGITVLRYSDYDINKNFIAVCEDIMSKTGLKLNRAASKLMPSSTASGPPSPEGKAKGTTSKLMPSSTASGPPSPEGKANKEHTVCLTANDIYRDGRGVARLNGKICFVDNLLINESAECEIIKEEKNYIVARALKLTSPSPDRTAPDCPVYERCGGCDYRHTTYENELKMKLIALRAAYRRYGISLNDDIPILPSDSERRNKVTFHVSRQGGVECGFYDKGSHDFVSGNACRLVSDGMKSIAARMTDWLKANAAVTEISLRESADGKETSLLLEAKSFNINAAALETALENSGVTSAGIRVGRKYKHLFGNEYITDTLCGNKLMISPNAFYQVNPAQAQRAYLTALDFADAKDTDILLDVCCGIGSIGLAAAKRVKEVYGIEIVKEAVDNANANAALNGIQNARFFCADAAAGLKALKDKNITPDIAVVDPPRGGLDGACIGALTDFGLKRIAYISCEPSTQARDVKSFLDNGYTLERICAVDFFRRTRHIESVALLNAD